VIKFKRPVEQHIADFPPEVKDGPDTRFAGVLETIRKVRNESGHPTGTSSGGNGVFATTSVRAIQQDNARAD
jgi:hypothetical protein